MKQRDVNLVASRRDGDVAKIASDLSRPKSPSLDCVQRARHIAGGAKRSNAHPIEFVSGGDIGKDRVDGARSDALDDGDEETSSHRLANFAAQLEHSLAASLVNVRVVVMHNVVDGALRERWMLHTVHVENVPLFLQARKVHRSVHTRDDASVRLQGVKMLHGFAHRRKRPETHEVQPSAASLVDTAGCETLSPTPRLVSNAHETTDSIIFCPIVLVHESERHESTPSRRPSRHRLTRALRAAKCGDVHARFGGRGPRSQETSENAWERL